MNNPLPEAVKKLGTVDRLLAPLSFFLGSGMQKYQVKVRAVAKLQSTEFAVSNNGKALFAALPV